MDTVKCPECGQEIIILPDKMRMRYAIEHHAGRHMEKRDEVITDLTKQVIKKIGDAHAYC